MKKQIKKIINSQKQKAILVSSAFHASSTNKGVKITGVNIAFAIFVIVWASLRRFT